MKAMKKHHAGQERLNAVARKLGHAAGTLTRATRELGENLSALPETVATRLRETTNFDTPAERSRARARPLRKTTRRSARAQTTKGRATVEKSRSPKNKTLLNRKSAHAKE